MVRSLFVLLLMLLAYRGSAQSDSLVHKSEYQSLSEQNQSARQIYNIGYKLYLDGKYSAALQHFNRAVKLKPYYPDAYRARASVKEALKDNLGALVDYETVVRQDDNNQEAIFKIAHIHQQLGNYEECIDKIDELIELPVGVTNAVFYKMDQSGGGVKEVLTLQSQKADFYNLRAQCYAGKKDFSSAVQDFNKAIDLDENDPDLLVNRGGVYQQMGKASLAENDFKKALTIDPWHKAAIFNLSLGKDHVSDQLMIDSYTSALQRNDQLAEAYVNRGVLWFEKKEYNKALADFDSAYHLMPEDADVLLNRGLTHEKLGNYQQSLQDFQKALAYGSDAYLVYGYQANALFHLKEYEKAEAYYTLAINIIQDSKFYFNRGLCRHRLQKHQLACQDFKTAAKDGIAVAEKAMHKYCNEDL